MPLVCSYSFGTARVNVLHRAGRQRFDRFRVRGRRGTEQRVEHPQHDGIEHEIAHGVASPSGSSQVTYQDWNQGAAIRSYKRKKTSPSRSTCRSERARSAARIPKEASSMVPIASATQ